jgi:hypothetical protein
MQITPKTAFPLSNPAAMDQPVPSRSGIGKPAHRQTCFCEGRLWARGRLAEEDTVPSRAIGLVRIVRAAFAMSSTSPVYLSTPERSRHRNKTLLSANCFLKSCTRALALTRLARRHRGPRRNGGSLLHGVSVEGSQSGGQVLIGLHLWDLAKGSRGPSAQCVQPASWGRFTPMFPTG